MFVLKSDKILYVDVDDTLVTWKGTSYVPHQGYIDLIKRFYARGQAVIVWSAGGYEWAERIVLELKLEDYVTGVMCKPVWWADDLTAQEVLLPSGRIYFEPENK